MSGKGKKYWASFDEMELRNGILTTYKFQESKSSRVPKLSAASNARDPETCELVSH